MSRVIREQIATSVREDPSARSSIEIVLCCPGFHALLAYRAAHRPCCWGVPLLPRLTSQVNQFLTGIESRPGATIGRRFFIDRGVGVVIGDTADPPIERHLSLVAARPLRGMCKRSDL